MSNSNNFKLLTSHNKLSNLLLQINCNIYYQLKITNAIKLKQWSNSSSKNAKNQISLIITCTPNVEVIQYYKLLNLILITTNRKL